MEKKLESLKKKFADKNYILLGFKSQNARDKEIVEEDDCGIIDLDSAIDWKAVFDELVLNEGHEVLGCNLPGLEINKNNPKLLAVGAVIKSYKKPVEIKSTPAEEKTEDKIKEAKARLKKDE